MMSANAKANIKQQEIEDLVALSYIFFKKIPSKFEIQCKRGCIFHLIFVGIRPSILMFCPLTTGGGQGFA